ncbi:MAG: adenylosuccinate synthetase, partial [Bacteroidota bacterium]
IKVCTGYKVNGKMLKQFPTDVQTLDVVEPVYKSFEGWVSKTSAVKKYAGLPRQARKYLEAIQKLLKTDIWMVSVGARRDQTLVVR